MTEIKMRDSTPRGKLSSLGQLGGDQVYWEEDTANWKKDKASWEKDNSFGYSRKELIEIPVNDGYFWEDKKDYTYWGENKVVARLVGFL